MSALTVLFRRPYSWWLLLPVLLQTAFTNGQITRQFAYQHHLWLMYNGDHKFSERWGVHLEAQLRRSDWGTTPQQLLLRTALNFHLQPNAFVSAGYGFIETYPYGSFPVQCAFPEHRLWQQLQIKTQISRFEIINRYRIEQRFAKLPVSIDGHYQPGPAVYYNRMRWLARFSLPLKGSEINDKSWYISLYDEAFVSFGKNVALNVFDQNRFGISIGNKIPLLGRLEIGYVEQTIIKSDGLKTEFNSTLLVALNSTIPFYKTKK